MIASAVVASVMAATALYNPYMGPDQPPPHPRSASDAINWDSQPVAGPRGIDISRWDHLNGRSVDFDAAGTQGVSFVFIKASDSIQRAQVEAKGWWDIDAPKARASKMLVGGYQYASPKGDPNIDAIHADAIGNALKMVSNLGPLPAGYLPPVLDLESAPMSLNKVQLTKWAAIWGETIQTLTGRTPIIYTYTNFMKTRLKPTLRFKKFPLWQAEYGRGMRRPQKVSRFQDPIIWQFTSNGIIPGAGADRTDLNVLRRQPRYLLRLAGLTLADRAATRV